jgi:hypothetical protein
MPVSGREAVTASGYRSASGPAKVLIYFQEQDDPDAAIRRGL